MISVEKKPEKNSELQKINCGIVMPISEWDGCSSNHWEEVRNIMAEAANSFSQQNC